MCQINKLFSSKYDTRRTSNRSRKAKRSSGDTLQKYSIRNKIFEVAEQTGLLIQAGSGALAKLVRAKSNLPKAHWIDAAANSIGCGSFQVIS